MKYFRKCLLLAVLTVVSMETVEGKRRKHRSGGECALFHTSSYEAMVEGVGTYIELGNLAVAEEFEFSFDVLPSYDDPNGCLFSISTKTPFSFKDWDNSTRDYQYILMAFSYESLELVLKDLGYVRPLSMEAYKTYPTPYEISDGNWHHIQVLRSIGVWKLSIDDVMIDWFSLDNSDVDIESEPAFLGGRPGYSDMQFRGVIKNLRYNGETLRLAGKDVSGDVEVVDCMSPLAQSYIDELREDMFRRR